MTSPDAYSIFATRFMVPYESQSEYLRRIASLEKRQDISKRVSRYNDIASGFGLSLRGVLSLEAAETHLRNGNSAEDPTLVAIGTQLVVTRLSAIDKGTRMIDASLMGPSELFDDVTALPKEIVNAFNEIYFPEYDRRRRGIRKWFRLAFDGSGNYKGGLERAARLDTAGRFPFTFRMPPDLVSQIDTHPQEFILHR